jgi:hypothetical protein
MSGIFTDLLTYASAWAYSLFMENINAVQTKQTLPTSCPQCGAGIVISIQNAYCEANKYASYSGAGDCRWSLFLTPELRRQADAALESQNRGRDDEDDYIETTEESERSSWARAVERNARQRARGQA